ncbi:MAG: hypothetical protein VKS61_13565 [Candidatus Sericytochromatia bacterium]|nr:hypothetical protein [Candidatus Sericytochromatia bacterium]
MRPPLALLLLLTLLAPACADREGEAREAMKGAALEIAAARRLEAESYDGALAHYEGALETVERVRAEYADTVAGALAAKPSTFVGPVTLGVLEGVILPGVRRRAEAERSPLACAALMAEAVPAPAPRVRALAAVAEAAGALDKGAIAKHVIARAQATAAGLPAASDAQDAAWSAVADALIATRELEQARALILANGFEGPWQRLAVALVRTGQARRAAGMVAHAMGGEALPRVEARATIAAALWKEGDAATAQVLMGEAELEAKAATAEAVPRVGLILARQYAAQRLLAQADAWLAQVDGLRTATREELDGLVEAYRAGGGEARLLAQVHRALREIEAGSRALPVDEVPWLTNLAYVQAKLGEAEPGAFALSQARARADTIAPEDAPPALSAEVRTLLDISERLLVLGHVQPGLGALEDALARRERLPLPERVAIVTRGASLAARAGRGERATTLVALLTEQDQIAIALAQAARAAHGGFSAPPRALHDLVARFDGLEDMR